MRSANCTNNQNREATHMSISNPHFHVMCPIRSIEPDSRWGNKQRREYVLDAPDKPSGKRVQHIHIKYDGLGFISLNELMRKEMA